MASRRNYPSAVQPSQRPVSAQRRPPLIEDRATAGLAWDSAAQKIRGTMAGSSAVVRMPGSASTMKGTVLTTL